MRNTMRLAPLAALAVICSSTAAFAHTGDHSHMDAWQSLRHALTQPDHLLAFVAAGILALLAGSVLVAKFARAERPAKARR
jgi:hydrogenase/urease accessory protein HupE